VKKLIVALILVVVLTVSFATPAFAGDGKGNMPGKADELGLWHGLWGALFRIAWGWHWGSGNGAHTHSGWGIGVSVRHAIFNIMDSEPPAHNWNGPEPEPPT